MGKKRRSSPVGTAGNEKERQRKTQKVMLPSHAPVPPGFIAKPAIPKSKHHTYLEFVENTEKRKKKLEFQVKISTPLAIAGPISHKLGF